MALSFKDAMNSVHLRADEVATLANRGDELAMKVISYYTQSWEAFHKAYHNEEKVEPTLKANLISSVTDYLHRDLTASSLVDLQSKFNHRVK